MYSFSVCPNRFNASSISEPGSHDLINGCKVEVIAKDGYCFAVENVEGVFAVEAFFACLTGTICVEVVPVFSEKYLIGFFCRTLHHEFD